MFNARKLQYVAGGVAALVLAAFVGAAAALATASALDDDDDRVARSVEPRLVLPEIDGPFGFDRVPRFESALDLGAAADYLDLTVEELHDELAKGRSLADIARDEGKSVDGLVQALVDAAEERIDDAVAAGRLSEDAADELKEDLEERMRDRVDDELPPKPFRFDNDFELPRGFNG
jgi:hypothetical protein